MVERATLYKWLQIEEIKEQLFTAVEKNHNEEFLDAFYDYLTTAVNEERDWSELPWIELRNLFQEVEEKNTPTKSFPILNTKSKTKKVEWTYPGRDWYFWLHHLSSNYGWDIEYVKSLDIDDAVGLLQEALIEKQEHREFVWATSEIAYAYNKNTGKSRLQPLDKPNWMKPRKVVEPKETKIRRDFMPVGAVVSWENHAKS